MFENYTVEDGFHYHDIALLHLIEPVDLTDSHRSVCLPPVSVAMATSSVTGHCYTAGWGFTNRLNRESQRIFFPYYFVLVSNYLKTCNPLLFLACVSIFCIQPTGPKLRTSIFYLLRRVVGQRPVYDYYMAELPHVHRTSILGMNPNCLYAGPGD